MNSAGFEPIGSRTSNNASARGTPLAAYDGLGGGGGQQHLTQQQRFGSGLSSPLSGIGGMGGGGGGGHLSQSDIDANIAAMAAAAGGGGGGLGGGGGSRSGTPLIYAGQQQQQQHLNSSSHLGGGGGGSNTPRLSGTPPPQQYAAQQQQQLSLQQQMQQLLLRTDSVASNDRGGGGSSVAQLRSAGGTPMAGSADVTRANSNAAFGSYPTGAGGSVNGGGGGRGSLAPTPNGVPLSSAEGGYGSGMPNPSDVTAAGIGGGGGDGNDYNTNHHNDDDDDGAAAEAAAGYGGAGGGAAASSTRYHSTSELRDTAMAAINQSIDAALRAEVKRMREEVTRLRKEAQRAARLDNEVKFLRNVTLLQHEEKVPIRLRELERDNLSLRRQVAVLEERLKSYDNDEYRQRLALQRSLVGSGGGGAQPVLLSGINIGGGGGDHHHHGHGTDGGGDDHGADGQAGGGSAGASGMGGRRPTSLMRTRQTSMSPLSATRRGLAPGGLAGTIGGVGMMGAAADPSSGATPSRTTADQIVIKPSDAADSCAGCRLKIAAMERVTRADRRELQEALSVTQSRLEAANAELTAVQNWVKSVVANSHQFPHTASQQPSLERVAGFAGPTAAGHAAARDRQLDPRSALGSAYYDRYADPHTQGMSGLTWSSAVAPQPSYLEARRR